MTDTAQSPDSHATPVHNRAVATPAGLAGPQVNRGRLTRLRQDLPGIWRKNRGLLVRPAFWSLIVRLTAARIARLGRRGAAAGSTKAAAEAAQPVIFVATHHKVMTTYFTAVLRLLSFGLGRRFEAVQTRNPDPKARVVLSMHGKLDLDRMRPYRGVHIMRDPRDMIVSGYHYHKWTHEPWVHRRDETGTSYQEKLNSVPPSEGLSMEIDHFLFFYRETLESWNIDDPDVLEIAYEDLMAPGREALYTRIFQHLGLSGRDLGLAVDLMRLFEADSRTGRRPGTVQQKSHLRSGKSGQWQKELAPDHVARIEAELGPVLRKFGY